VREREMMFFPASVLVLSVCVHVQVGPIPSFSAAAYNFFLSFYFCSGHQGGGRRCKFVYEPLMSETAENFYF
jgi:hypothetical protein